MKRRKKPHQCRWPMDNVKSNPDYDPKIAAKSPIHFMEIARGKNITFSEGELGGSTPVSGDTGSEGTESPMLGTGSSELHNEFCNAVMKTYVKHKQWAYCFNFFNKNMGSQNWNPS
ncbi:hypothetical protein O181_039951 [Austropuccinia psidii MF-1]|uniref:Uncharacterized protein n=1 Tax=Austropuccinia psidii MF-1 TaxID=1389203 RepID=A0A9Q3DAI7_9BASI|nr:hypothetical protein [Austropuccinia psidii MF-1]